MDMFDDDMDLDLDFMETDEPKRSTTKKGHKLSRAEKSRVAAQSRRDKEAVAMEALMKELPISMETLNKMDKASVVRLAICYIKIKHYVQKDMVTRAVADKNQASSAAKKTLAITDKSNSSDVVVPEFTPRPDEGNLMLEALNGFVILINCKGTIRFVSSTVEEHLGYRQIQLLGKNIIDYIHPTHHGELAKQFAQEHKYDVNGCTSSQQVFYVKMKYNLPKPGSKAKHTGYMLVHWSGKMKRHRSQSGQIKKDGLLCVCRPMQTTSIVEVRMDGNMFMSRHDLGMTFTYCDARILSLVGYEPNEVIGKTAYHFHNPIDAIKVSNCHQNLIMKGSAMSKYYRFLGKMGHWVWLQTRATIIYNTSNKPQYVICMNYLISEEEGERYLMLEEHKHANDHLDVIEIQNNNFPVSSENDLQRANITEICDSTPCNASVSPIEIDPPIGVNFSSQNSQQQDVCDSNVVQGSPVSSFQHDVLLDDSQDEQLTPVCYQQQQQQQQQPEEDLIMQLLQSDSNYSPQTFTSDSVGSHDVSTGIVSPPVADNQNMANDLTSGSPLPYNVDNVGDQLVNYAQVVACHGNDDGGSYDDAGYESATSPYSSKHNSPQDNNVCNSSAGGNDDDIGEFGHSDTDQFIQGKDCSIGACYTDKLLQDDNAAMFPKGNTTEEVLQDDSDILDKLLESLAGADTAAAAANLDTNMATIFSTIQSFMGNTTTVPLMTNIQKLSAETPFKVLSPATATDKPLLWSLLKCPEDDIPKTPVSSPTNLGKNSQNGSCPGTPINGYGSNPTSPASSVASTCQDPLLNPLLNPLSQLPVLEAADISKESQAALVGADVDMPKEVSDFALQYLEGLLDSGNHSFMEFGGESVMDTSEDVDVGKLLLNSLGVQGDVPTTVKEDVVNNDILFSNQCQATQAFQKSRLFQKSECPVSAISVSRCNVLSGQGAGQCSTANVGSTVRMSPAQLGNYRVFAPPHNDHGYHQNINKMNNGVHRGRSQPVCDNRSAKTIQCSTSQTQTRMSELEMCLRGFDKGHNQSCKTTYSSDSSKPFLQQLLTGELTNDRYMEMEYDRSNTGLPR